MLDTLKHIPRDLIRDIRFQYQRRFKEMRVSDQPAFDPDSQPFFSRSLEQANKYLEYGMGGSTIMAARLKKDLTAVESDGLFTRAIERKITDEKLAARLIYADIGPTKMWGKPRFTLRTPKRLAAWAHYVRAPYNQGQDTFYDLVLVDGRFRVACALEAIRQSLKAGAAFTLLFDDYKGRAHYHAIESFARPAHMAGRMAVFHIAKESLLKEPTQADVDHFIRDWR